jgi:hypothetical protein
MSKVDLIQEYSSRNSRIFSRRKDYPRTTSSTTLKTQKVKVARCKVEVASRKGLRADTLNRFVCTTAHETKEIIRLRSYKITGELDDLSPTILEAALATSAATSYFEPVIINGLKFVDGALGAKNPVDEVWNEAQNI